MASPVAKSMTIEERVPDKWSIPINTGTMDEGLNDGHVRWIW